MRRRGEEAERRDRVVPDGRHRLRALARDADVVGDREVEEAGAVAGLRDADDIVDGRVRLPRLREDRALGDDRQLHAVGESARRNDLHGRPGARHAQASHGLVSTPRARMPAMIFSGRM